MNTYVSYCRKQKSYITNNLICSNRDACTGCTFCPNLTRFKNPVNIDGFNKLDDEQKAIFSQFILNFFNGWGTEVRNSIEPIFVSPQYDSYFCIRFDYLLKGKPEWLHVVDAKTWF